jgi:hypothetical protein
VPVALLQEVALKHPPVFLYLYIREYSAYSGQGQEIPYFSPPIRLWKKASSYFHNNWLPVLDEFRNWLCTEEAKKLYKELVMS